MPVVSEEEVYKALLRYSGEGTAQIGDTEVRLRLRPVDVHNLGRPDAILWVEISFKVFGQTMSLRVPLPVEAEKNGIDEAMEDLDAFAEREKFPLAMPMLVVAEAGYQTREERRHLPVDFTIRQIPIRRLIESG